MKQVLAWILLPLFGGIGAYGRFRTEAAILNLMHKTGITAELAENAPLIRHTAKAWPIMLVNVVGCFVAGLLAGAGIGDSFWALPIGTGLLGGWTTFSTAMMDAYSIAFSHERHPLRTRSLAAIIVAVATFLFCVFAAMAGLAVTVA